MRLQDGGLRESGRRSGKTIGRHCIAGLATIALLVALQESAAARAAPVEQGARQPGAQDGGVGIKVKSRKAVLFGNAKKSRTPATLDSAKALEATAEVRKIRDENIPKGSAQYSILMHKARRRLSKTLRKVALAEGRDCVVKKGAIRSNPNGLKVVDLTDSVVDALSGKGGADGGESGVDG